MLFLNIKIVEVFAPVSYTNKKGITKDITELHVKAGSYYFNIKGYSEDVLSQIKNVKPNEDVMLPVRASGNKFNGFVNYWVVKKD